jgi:hypothetical protein
MLVMRNVKYACWTNDVCLHKVKFQLALVNLTLCECLCKFEGHFCARPMILFFGFVMRNVGQMVFVCTKLNFNLLL